MTFICCGSKILLPDNHHFYIIKKETSGSWGSLETVATNLSGGRGCIYIDSNGDPQVFFRGKGSPGQQQVSHAYVSGASWTRDIINTSGSLSGYPSAMEWTGGTKKVAFHQQTSAVNYLELLTYDGSWTSENLVSSANQISRTGMMSVRFPSTNIFSEDYVIQYYQSSPSKVTSLIMPAPVPADKYNIGTEGVVTAAPVAGSANFKKMDFTGLG